MPPAESDPESSPGEDIPFRAKAANMNADDEVEDEEEDEGEGEGDDEFIVEKIVDHKVDKKGKIKLQVKWLGWGVADNTWEPEEALAQLEETAKYYRHLGGRPTRDKPKPKSARPAATGAKRKSTDTPPKTLQGHDGASNKRLKKANENLIYDEDGKEPFVAPSGLWEDHIIAVDTIEEASGNPPVKHAYVIWKNERKSKHRLPVLNQKCPQVMLRFYESHLQFTSRLQEDFEHETDDDKRAAKPKRAPAPATASPGQVPEQNGHDAGDEAEGDEMEEIKGVISAAQGNTA